MKPKLVQIPFSLAIAAGLAVSAISSLAQNVNVTGTLTYVRGTGGVYDYTLTLSNSGPEAVESLWLGWTVGNFDIASPTSVGNTVGWSSSVQGNSVQFGGSAGTAIASGGTGTFTFDSTSTPAQFQAGTAGPSVVYGVNATQFAIENTTLDSEKFTPTVVVPVQNVNVTGSLTYVQGAGGVYDYTLTLSNSGPEAVESLWLGWTLGGFNVASPTSVGNTVGWTNTVDGNSIQFGGAAGTAIASGSTGTFTFDSISTPAQFQAGTAGPSVAYGVNASQFTNENTTPDSEEFTPTVVVPVQNVNVTATLTYVQGTGGVYDYTLTLHNTGPEAVESLWLGWTLGGFNVASPTSAGNTVGWTNTVDGNSIEFGGAAGTAIASGGSGTFTFNSTSTPADFQAGTAGPSVVYGVNASQFAIENTTSDSEEFTPTFVAPPPNVNVTGTLTYVQGTGGAYGYTLTLSNSGPEAIESLWLGWTVGVFDIASPTSVGNTVGWTNSIAGNSIQYGGSAGTTIAAGGLGIFTFDSTSTPAQFQAGTAGPAVVYGVNASQFAIENTTLDSEEFTPVVSNSIPVITVPIITIQPQSQSVLVNATVTFFVTASNAISYQWQSNMVAIPGQTNTSLILSNVVVGDSGNYRVVVSNASGSVTSSVAALVVGYPASITQEPSNVDVLAGTPVTFQVEATGSPAPQFQWFLNSVKLPGQTNAILALEAATANIAGTYSVIVSNALGSQTSSNAVLTVAPLTSVIREKLTVTINPIGSGAVVPNLNGKSLIVAHSYTVAAVAGRGQVFANWSGILQSDSRSLTFVMPSVSNSTLTANFIPSPFASNGVAGAYSGLFSDTNNLSDATAGYFSATVASNGVISGQVKLAGVSTAFATNLYADGSAILELKRHNKSSLVLTIQVDLTGLQTLTGTVSDANNTFNAQLTAYRAGFSASHRAADYDGYYTWVMPGGAGNAPAGYSYGTATIAATGAVHLTLFLSDGATATAAGSLSTNGQIPLYVSLYGGKGSLLSWLSFTNSAGSLSTNGAYWFKDATAKNPYSYGFNLTNLLLWTGAYTAEEQGKNALNAANVSVQLSGADLTSTIAETIALNPNGIGGSSANITANISGKTGVFSGSFKDPVAVKTVHFHGAVLRSLSAGYGFFISGNLSGAVFIEPQ